MKTQGHRQGSTLVAALLTIFILSFAAAAVFYFVANRYTTAYQSSSWNEAETVAESGIDLAMQALNLSATSPSTAWAGWTPSDGTTFPKTYKGVLPPHAGGGNNKMYISVTVDTALSDASGNAWPRITSSGTAEVPGLKRVGYAAAVLSLTGVKNHKNILRKIAFTGDVTRGALHLPQATRTVQVVARPLATGIFKRSLVAENSISMSGGAYTDSFDSTNPAMSTNGQYDSSKRQSHGDVASNISGNSSNLNNSSVYGNAWSNGGAIKNTAGVTGKVYNNFSTTIGAVAAPFFSTMVSSPTAVDANGSGTTTLTAGTQAAPANYKLSEINVSGNGVLVLAPPSPGQDSYMNIWVTGDISTSGNGYIQQLAGVHANIYVAGNVSVSGNAFDNENNRAAYLTLNGITPTSGTNTLTVSGNGSFIGVVNAPAFALTISGNASFMGAVIVYSATISGNGGFHYDQSLGGSTGSNGLNYEMASWTENIE